MNCHVHPDAGASYSYHNWRYFPVRRPGKNGVQKFTADLFSHGLFLFQSLANKTAVLIQAFFSFIGIEIFQYHHNGRFTVALASN